MKTFVIVVLVCLNVGISYSQQAFLGCPRIFHSSNEIFDTTSGSCLKHIRENVFTNKITAVYQDNSRGYTSIDSVWGYRRKNDNPIRIVDKADYTLLQTIPVCLYRKGATKIRSYYFSTGLDGTLYPLTKKQLRVIFPNDSLYHVVSGNKNVKKFL
jgi:hypothetical protein